MERKFEIMEALGGVNTYFVEEAIPGSPQMKDRSVLRLTTIAASFVLIAAMGFIALFASGMIQLGGGFTPGAHGGDIYGETSDDIKNDTDTEKTEETVPPDSPGVDQPFYLENGEPVLLSEMSDEALLAAVDAVTGEDRNDAYGAKYRYGLYDALYKRFWTTENEESFRAAFLSALREAAKCDEAADSVDFIYDTAGRDAFARVTIDYNGNGTEDNVMYDWNSFCPSKEFYAVFDLVVIRYYLEYYDVYADGVITQELAGIYLSAFGEAVECFDDGTRELLWPSRMFEPMK